MKLSSLFNPACANLCIGPLPYKMEFISPNIIYVSVSAASLVVWSCGDIDSMVFVVGVLLGVDGGFGNIPARMIFCNPTFAASLCVRPASWSMTFFKLGI